MENTAPAGYWKSKFEKNLSRIQHIVRDVSRRNGLGADEAADFSSYVMLKLIENGYSRFRKYRGEASLETYLATVVLRLLLDYRRCKWGKWRSSAKAKSLGPLATRLEVLIYRDGYDFHEAAQILSSESQRPLLLRELQDVFVRLPVRHRPHHVRAQFFDLADDRSTSWLLEAAEARTVSTELCKVLGEAFSELDDESQLILRLRYQGGLTIKQTAMVMGIRARTLYPRIERILQTLKTELERNGLTRSAVFESIEQLSIDLDMARLPRLGASGNRSIAAV